MEHVYSTLVVFINLMIACAIITGFIGTFNPNGYLASGCALTAALCAGMIQCLLVKSEAKCATVEK